ncbi:MAG: MBL fold metallo-hydrolase [Clostridia bacterium]|nr:MBL fold metallo-hydrolase [Clostridia bacterium]
MYRHKRRKICLLLLTLLFLCTTFGCGVTDNNELKFNTTYNNGAETTGKKFVVHFLSVGDGNCTFIKFPDCKTMLIDCGNTDKKDELNGLLKNYSNKIDYLVLSHPDIDHIGNGKSVVSENEIKTCFVPYIINPSLFPFYSEIYNTLTDKCEDIRVSSEFKRIDESDYSFMFLYPENEKDPFGKYAEFNRLSEPTESDVDALCPIIYLECFGISFLLFSDDTSDMEKKIVENYKVGFYEGLLDREINLNNIDFLLVPNHGGNRGTTQELLEVIKPKNAIISVGLDSLKNNPSSHVIERLNTYCEKIYRTDICGTITVSADDINYSVHTLV